MGVMKDRAGCRAELLLTGCLKALIQLSALVIRVLCDLAGDRGYFSIAACNAADSIRPAHLLKVIPAGFFGLKFLVYVYEVHFPAPLNIYALPTYREILSRNLICVKGIITQFLC